MSKRGDKTKCECALEWTWNDIRFSPGARKQLQSILLSSFAAPLTFDKYLWPGAYTTHRSVSVHVETVENTFQMDTQAQWKRKYSDPLLQVAMLQLYYK